MPETNARGLLRSMAIIGGAQVVNIVISILRVKVVAVLLGPSGVGLLGVLNNLREMGAMGAGLGLGSSGVRELSAAKGESATLSRVRRVLLGALFLQGFLAMALIWIFRVWLAEMLLGSSEHSTEVGLVGVAVFLFLIGTSQTALLQGMRRIGDLGRVTVWGALLGTLAGLAAVFLSGRDGLIWLILMPPVAGILVALRYTRRLPPPDAVPMTLTDAWRAWLPMVRLGVVFMIGSLLTISTLLLVRARITQELGLDAAGHFAAAWSITMIYLGFLLQAMGADYFPRLTEVIHDREAVTRLMNDQMQLAVALGGPILLVLIGCAPWLIRLLYSSEFESAVVLLQWQAVGNVFKLASWALSFAFMAAAHRKVFLMTELLFNALFLPLVWIGVAFVGLDIAGYAFLISYLVYFAVVALLVHCLYGFRWQPLSLRLLGLHATFAAALLLLALNHPGAGALASLGFGLGTALWGVHVIISKIGSHGRLVSSIAQFYNRLGWPIRNMR